MFYFHNSEFASNPQAIGLRMKELREEQKLSQTQIADLCGMSQAQWSKMERGDFDKTSMLFRIAKTLGAQPLWLETGEGDKYHESNVLQEPAATYAPEVSVGLTPRTRDVWKQYERFKDPAQARLNHSILMRAAKLGALDELGLNTLASMAKVLMAHQEMMKEYETLEPRGFEL